MNTNQIIVHGRLFKLRYSAPQYALQLPWSVSCRIDGEGSGSGKLFFQERDGQSLEVAFCVPALGLVLGSAFFDARPLIVNGDVSLAFTGTGRLEQLRDWPQTLPPDKQMAHGVTSEHLEREVQSTVRGLCPPDVDVAVRRTTRMKGLPANTIVVEMAVGGDPW